MNGRHSTVTFRVARIVGVRIDTSCAGAASVSETVRHRAAAGTLANVLVAGPARCWTLVR
jgi:hypothetical protein